MNSKEARDIMVKQLVDTYKRLHNLTREKIDLTTYWKIDKVLGFVTTQLDEIDDNWFEREMNIVLMDDNGNDK